MGGSKPKPTTSGNETKQRILDATTEALRTVGVGGTSARTIASLGGFNQALIFYHFGSLDGAIVAAVKRLVESRYARHQKLVEEAGTLQDLVAVARTLHEADKTDGNMQVLSQAMAAAAHNPGMGEEIYATLQPWNQLLAAKVDEIAQSYGEWQAIPSAVVAKTVTATFLGIELLDDLAPQQQTAMELLDALDSLCELLDVVLQPAVLDVLRAMSPP